MGTYNLPRNVKGEGRILFIFTRKSIMYTGAAALIGAIFYLILSFMGQKIAGFVVLGIFALIGFIIGTFKMPDLGALKVSRIVGGENLDDIIKRFIIFKKKHNKIYMYEEDETNDK